MIKATEKLWWACTLYIKIHHEIPFWAKHRKTEEAVGSKPQELRENKKKYTVATVKPACTNTTHYISLPLSSFVKHLNFSSASFWESLQPHSTIRFSALTFLSTHSRFFQIFLSQFSTYSSTMQTNHLNILHIFHWLLFPIQLSFIHQPVILDLLASCLTTDTLKVCINLYFSSDISLFISHNKMDRSTFLNTTTFTFFYSYPLLATDHIPCITFVPEFTVKRCTFFYKSIKFFIFSASLRDLWSFISLSLSHKKYLGLW